MAKNRLQDPDSRKQSRSHLEHQQLVSCSASVLLAEMISWGLLKTWITADSTTGCCPFWLVKLVISCDFLVSDGVLLGRNISILTCEPLRFTFPVTAMDGELEMEDRRVFCCFGVNLPGTANSTSTYSRSWFALCT